VSTTAAVAQTQAFVIDASRSTAAFEIDEVLRGEPKTVVGTTSEVAGQVVVDPSDLSTIEFSQIIVNARTFQTGSGNRDRAIRGPVILDSASDEFEFITFDVTSVDDLAGSLTVGEPLTFTVTGDLVIRGTSNEVTFDVTATPVDETSIEGVAIATVLRSDYGIGIPNVPGVADVGDEVVIRLEFVAES
jgi:polyisoprenoid-binding protein YceI